MQGPFNNWIPTEMQELSSICIKLLGAKEPDWMDILHDKGKCRGHCNVIEDLNEAEMHRLN